MPKKTKKIGLALGGGGARGCAHVGAIRALREAGIPIDFIAGSSVGAFVGGILSAGDIDKLEQYLLKIKWRDIIKNLDPVFPKKGFFGGKKICDILRFLIPKPNFKYSKIPFAAIATDLNSGKEVILREGNMIDAIRASIAIPGIFTPAHKNRRYLVDGGLINPLPVDVVREMGADIVIAIDLNHHFIKEQLRPENIYTKSKSKLAKWFTPSYPNIVDVIENSIFMMEYQLAQKNLMIHKPDFLIRPILKSASIFDFHQAKKLIAEGYEKTKEQIPEIKKMLNR